MHDDTILEASQAALLNSDLCDAATMSALAQRPLLGLALCVPYPPRFYKGGWPQEKERGTVTSIYEARSLPEYQIVGSEDDMARIKAAQPGEQDEELHRRGRFLGIMMTRALDSHRWNWDNNLMEKGNLHFLGLKPNQAFGCYRT